MGGPDFDQPALTPELEPDRGPEPATVAEARKWLSENGYPVGARGRISSEHKTAFFAATGRVVL